ncbi:DUF2202 domain-containing protein [Algoriphagus sp. PAP.12]|uniref:DUF2202 domain-containing protein n=1 Tax=Algoriphagus sp. PAP.12 TaxID=2996678 RepID=UPI00227C9805|nr:DUF2202 domain-containing protein [Algoriphagus sp. PAP.12]
MKRSILPLFILLAGLFSCQDEEKPMVSTTLSDAEIETLLFTREEEKLAHDVYIYAYEKYGNILFQNIANSESQHIQSILTQMNAFDISDPLNGSTIPGEFTLSAIQTLYDNLTSQVDQSLNDAIIAGLWIEDIDIYDLENAIAETSQSSLATVYGSLQCGSSNHMRAFYGLATQYGVDYSPSYISQTLYEDIITSAKTTCQNN